MTLDTTDSAPTSSSVIPPTEDDVARPAIVLDHVSKVYGFAQDAVHALDNVSLDIARANSCASSARRGAARARCST